MLIHALIFFACTIPTATAHAVPFCSLLFSLCPFPHVQAISAYTQACSEQWKVVTEREQKQGSHAVGAFKPSHDPQVQPTSSRHRHRTLIKASGINTSARRTLQGSPARRLRLLVAAGMGNGKRQRKHAGKQAQLLCSTRAAGTELDAMQLRSQQAELTQQQQGPD
ncbi:hypothetical protein ABPG75_013387 [Micractinium tetrahymenae]